MAHESIISDLRVAAMSAAGKIEAEHVQRREFLHIIAAVLGRLVQDCVAPSLIRHSRPGQTE
jgi:hypothetical protein